jgi:hypothetical protein
VLTRRRCCCGPPSCKICITTKLCVDAVLSNVTVTVTQGGTTVGTGTSNASGVCCIDVPESGSYVVTVTKTGYTGSNKLVNVTCPGTTAAVLTLQLIANQHRFAVQGCGSSGVPGATVTINDGSYTTDSSGYVYFSAPIATYSYSVSAPRFTTKTGTVNIQFCTGSQVGSGPLTPASGYHCSLSSCPYPLPDSVTLTDSVIGTTTLSWVADRSWEGTLTYSFPGYCGCPAKSTTMKYSLSFFGATPSLSISAKVFTFGCPDNSVGSAYSTLFGTSLADYVCPPSFSGSSSAVVCNCGSISCVGRVGETVYRGTNPTFTVTE